jgi:cell division protein ZapB
MKSDLTALEQKIEQFLAFSQGLRAENQALRSRVAGLEDERQQLLNKIDTARSRLEALLVRLPEEQTEK